MVQNAAKVKEDIRSVNAEQGCIHTELGILSDNSKLVYLTSQITALSSTKLLYSFIAVLLKFMQVHNSTYNYTWSFQKLLKGLLNSIVNVMVRNKDTRPCSG